MGDHSEGEKVTISEYSEIVGTRITEDDSSAGETIILSSYSDEVTVDAILYGSDGERVVLSSYSDEEYILASLTESSDGSNTIYSDYSNVATVTTPQPENIPFSKKQDKCIGLQELPDFSTDTGGHSSNHAGSRKQYTKTLP